MSRILTLDIPGAPRPEVALGRLSGLPGRVLLQSAGEAEGYSFLSAAPQEIVVVREGQDGFARLAEFLARWTVGGASGDLPFAGGAVGFLSYEAGDVLERLPQPRTDDVGVPLGWFGAFGSGILWDAPSGRCRAVGTVVGGRKVEEVRSELEEWARRIVGGAIAGGDEQEEVGNAIAGGDDREAAGDHPISSLSRDEFIVRVEKIRDYIRAGDIFQANLTRRLSARTALSGAELYLRLLSASPAPFAAYLDCGEMEIASVSPELFLSLRGREVRTSPIKGTSRRGATPDEDHLLRAKLEESEKDRAENIMIVDLLRNDLSRVSLPGSISVPKLAEVETHPTVHHLVSTVKGTLAPEVGAVDLLRATFPGGSITGAPKIRAMEILRELEPVRRGVYTGAIGIFGFHGDADLSIAIRTATLRDGVAYYGTGGGITLASSPEDEWEETGEKARPFLRALDATEALDA